MVGPSSSHTAGAVRIGYIARRLLREEPKRIDLKLHGSFAATGNGHGTIKAIVAGLLGMREDDMRIPRALDIAKDKKILVDISAVRLKEAHPNSVLINLETDNGDTLEVEGSSIGGGRVVIREIDGLSVNFSGELPTLIVNHDDQPGHIAEITTILAQLKLNIAKMQVYRSERGGSAVAVIETDNSIPDCVISWLEGLPGINRVTYINTEEKQ